MADALLVVLVSVVALTVVARRLRLPEPLVFLVGGAVPSLVPGLPTVTYDAEVVFLVFFPVLLFSAAFGTSWNDLRPNALRSVRTALGMVMTTTLLVGVVAHALIPELGWATALLLGGDPRRPRRPAVPRACRGRARPAGDARRARRRGLFEGTAELVLYLALSAAVTSCTFAASSLVTRLVVGPVLGARWALRSRGCWVRSTAASACPRTTGASARRPWPGRSPHRRRWSASTPWTGEQGRDIVVAAIVLAVLLGLTVLVFWRGSSRPDRGAHATPGLAARFSRVDERDCRRPDDESELL